MVVRIKRCSPIKKEKNDSRLEVSKTRSLVRDLGSSQDVPLETKQVSVRMVSFDEQ